MSFPSETDNEASEKMMLDLTSPKAENIFASDQTPTPTRLIKNCEEVGLFEDLRLVNPFDETFRRAVEQNVGQSSVTSAESNVDVVEDTLHTPQVFPQLEPGGEGVFQSCDLMGKPLGRLISVDDLADGNSSLFKIATYRQNSSSSTGSSSSGTGKAHKYRSIAEKSPPENCTLHNSMQLVQPQVTWSFGTENPETIQNRVNLSEAIPIQTVKSFILPKSTSSTKLQNYHAPVVETPASSNSTLPTTTVNEPSSASLTPTSQLPIKERLKAILSNSSKSRIVELPQKTTKQRTGRRSHQKFDDDCIERRRAAATRYRNKMRNEYKELRRRNTELVTDNENLRNRIRQLEQELENKQTTTIQQMLGNRVSLNVPSQIQLPSSTLHLVMNIPRILMPSIGKPILQNPITYTVQKK